MSGPRSNPNPDPTSSTARLAPPTAPTPASTSATAGGPSTLSRVDSRTSLSSVHTRNALRRMATHETGGGVERGYDGRDRAGGVEGDKDRERDRREWELSQHDEHEHEHLHEDEHEHDQAHDKRAGKRSRGANREHRRSSDPALDRPEDESHSSDTYPESGLEKGKTDVEAGAAGAGSKNPVELQDQTNLLPVRQVLVVFAGLSMALMCSMLDQTIVTTALPTLGQVFNRADIVSWVGTAYLLTSTAMQPIYGRLSDIFGRKPTLLCSCVIFFIGSLGCSVSQSMIMLICFRAIQGIGGGGILTLSMIIVSDIVTLEERGKYQGIIGIVVATSNSVGPVIGGSLTERATWRWCFWLTMPITALAFVIIVFLLPLRRVKGSYLIKLAQLDWLGSFLTLAWAVLVLIALSWAGSQHAWDSAAVLAPLIIGLSLLAVFLVVELKYVRLPLIPLYIFNDRTVSASMAATFLSGVAFYCTLYYLPTYFQLVKGVGAVQSGVLILPLTCVQTVCVFISGYFVSKTGDYWWNLTIGFGIWTVGLGLMSTINPYSSDAHLIGYQVVVGIGAGQTFQTSLVAIQAAVERKDMATATGTRNALRMLGGTIGLAACGTLVNNLAQTELLKRGYGEEEVGRILVDPLGQQNGRSDTEIIDVRESFSKGINGVFYLLIPLIGIAFLLNVFLVRKIPLKRADDAAKKEEAKAWVEKQKMKGKRGSRGHGDHHEDDDDREHDDSGHHIDVEKANGRTPVEKASAHPELHSRNGSGAATQSESHLERTEDELLDAGRALEEAAGVGVPRREGFDQGPVGAR